MLSSRYSAVATWAVVPALFVAIVVAGCSSHRPENNPYLAEKFAAIEEAIGSLERIEREVTLLRSDLDFFDQELADIKAMNGGLTPSEQEKMNEIASKLAEFDRLASELGSTKAVLTSAVSEGDTGAPVVFGTSGAAGATQVAAAETTKPEPKVETKAKTPTEAARKVFESRKSSTTKAGASSAKTTARKSTGSSGTYHVVQAGESITAIAKARGVSAVALAKKNKVPVNAMLPAGSRLWLPR